MHLSFECRKTDRRCELCANRRIIEILEFQPMQPVNGGEHSCTLLTEAAAAVEEDDERTMVDVAPHVRTILL